MYEKSFHLIIKSQHNSTFNIHSTHNINTMRKCLNNFKIEFPIQFTQTLHV